MDSRVYGVDRPPIWVGAGTQAARREWQDKDRESRQILMTTMKYSDRHLAGLFARPPDRVELIGAGSLGYGTGPSFG